MLALLTALLAGGIVGWLCHGHLWRALSLSVPASAVVLVVLWSIGSEPQEVEIQWMVSQPEFWVFVYVLLCLLPCAGGAAATTVFYRQLRNQNSK